MLFVGLCCAVPCCASQYPDLRKFLRYHTVVPSELIVAMTFSMSASRVDGLYGTEQFRLPYPHSGVMSMARNGNRDLAVYQG